MIETTNKVIAIVDDYSFGKIDAFEAVDKLANIAADVTDKRTLNRVNVAIRMIKECEAGK